MTDLRQAAKQALEALELSAVTVDSFKVQQAAQDSITTLRAALEQPEQEPVALIRDGVLRWHIPHEHYARPAWTAHGTHMLYTAQAQQQAEPVANQFNAGIEACMSRLIEMHSTASGRHNYYGHAALELAKLKGEA